jgi:tetratricopeptide (TPR) repeat protein
MFFNFVDSRMNFLSEAKKMLEQNLFTEALALVQEQRRSDPLDVEAHVMAGNILVVMGELDKARNMLAEVEQTISRLSFIFTRMADIYREKGLKNDAAQCYRKFMILNPVSEQAAEVAKKIALLYRQDADSLGRDDYCIENIPKPEFFTLTLADLYIKQGHLLMAGEVLKEMIKREPGNINAAAKLDLVKAAMSQGRPVSDKQDCSNDVVQTLSGWLDNIDRLNAHAAGK